MAIWELICDAMDVAHKQGEEWMTTGAAVRGVQERSPDNERHCRSNPEVPLHQRSQVHERDGDNRAVSRETSVRDR